MFTEIAERNTVKTTIPKIVDFDNTTKSDDDEADVDDIVVLTFVACTMKLKLPFWRSAVII